MRSYQTFIGGEDLPAENWIHVIAATDLMENPLAGLRLKRTLDRGLSTRNTSAVAGRVARSTPAQWAQATAAARAAQREWARRPLADRLELGAALREIVHDRLDEFVAVLIAEGHPRRLAEWEVAGVLQGLQPETMNTLAALLERVEHVGGRELRLVRKPDGVVCLSPPQNAAASNSMLGVSTLFAGNAIVVKAPRSGPLGVAWAWRELVGAACAEVNAPPGLVNVICGDPAPIMDHWLESPDVDTVFYFGDSRRGMEIGRRCAVVDKKSLLELAGNDGLVVWADAELDLAARALSECFYGSSQICMVPKYAVVHPDIADDLIARVVKMLDDVRPGLPDDPEALLTPVLRSGDFFKLIDESTAAGATLVAGGQRTDHTGELDEAGVFLQPTVLRIDGLAHADELRVVREETFFPLLPIVVADTGDLSTMIDFIEANPYGLRNSLWAQDPEVIDEFCRSVCNGGLLKINDSHLGFAPTLPTHGGTGLTGGPHGEVNFPALRTSRLQGISIATGVTPRESIFDSAKAT